MTNEQKNYEKAKKAKIEYMREQVQELELQARFWRAQFELKEYTLKDYAIKDEYDKYIIKMQEDYLNQLAAEREQQEAEQELSPQLTSESTPL